MANAELVVDGYSISISPINGATPGSWDDDFIVIKEDVSTKVKAEGNGAMKGPLMAKTAMGCSLPGYTFVTGVAQVPASTVKTKVEGLTCYNKNSTGSCLGTFTLSSYPFTPFVCSCSLSVSDAGQTKVKCE